MAEEGGVQAFLDGLSRIDRVLDDSGFAFTALDVNDKQLSSLESIKQYPHLLFVNVARNQIADASPLAELPYLVSADLSDNMLAGPPSFPNEHLQALDVSGNQIPTLQGLQSASLASLKMNGNALESLAGISGLPALTALEASLNAIASLDALGAEEPPKLEHLQLGGNQLTTVDGIDRLPSLQVLGLEENAIEALEALEKLRALPTLRELSLKGNPVADADNYRLSVILLAPTLAKLDDEQVTDDERVAAVDLRQQRAEEAAATAADADE